MIIPDEFVCQEFLLNGLLFVGCLLGNLGLFLFLDYLNLLVNMNKVQSEYLDFPSILRFIGWGLISAGLGARLLSMLHMQSLDALAIGFFLGAFTLATDYDRTTSLVYDCLWTMAIAGISPIIFAILLEESYFSETVFRFFQCILYIALQEFLLGRKYGRADAHAFGSSALLLFCLKGSWVDFLMEFSMAFLLLGIHQRLRKNVIRGSGKLRVPVPFLPYILPAFLFVIGMQSFQSIACMIQ